MFRWKKLGKVFDPRDYQDKSWLHEYAQAPATLIFDNFVRVYFSCRPPKDENDRFVSYSAFVDLDRKNLFNIINMAKQPILPLGKKGCFDEFGVYPFSVIRKDKQIWGYYGGWTRCESTPVNVSIGIAVSNDNGETFERLGDGPVLSYSINEPFNVGSARIRKFDEKFYLFYICSKKWITVNGRMEFSSKIRLASSYDGINWERLNKDLISNILNENESQASPDVIYKNEKYHMFFCNWDPLTFRKTKSRKIGYAYSTDLINWTRDDSLAGIDVSEDGWDSEMIAYPHVFELDGKIYMLYLGNEVGRYGFGLAELEGELK